MQQNYLCLDSEIIKGRHGNLKYRRYFKQLQSLVLLIFELKIYPGKSISHQKDDLMSHFMVSD